MVEIAFAIGIALGIVFIKIVTDLWRGNVKLDRENERLANEVIELCRQNNRLRMEVFVSSKKPEE